MRPSRFEDAVVHPKYRVGPGQLLPDAQVDAATAGLFTVEEVTHGIVRSTPYISAQLDTTDENVVMIEQVTSLGDVPLYVNVSYSPVGVDFSRFSAAVRALDELDEIPDVAVAFEILYGRQYGGYHSTMEAFRCDAVTASRLGIDEGATILSREMTLFDVDRTPWNLCWSRYRPDLTRVSATTSHT
ncbi:UTRA domain-containing protein [Rhodococcoides kyotonense]|uniref:UTRA domain-containing protein n=1 Tax=Rhodococcoides kyotonense TaxID=398843 RepID=A0A239DZQ9_9NOCA|nr:UTRA domain-containing protein [Rhodococcus kyotonensis]SNS37965.1 UTRA domain-containing protein [Rhodococcus kyotonensis]